MWGPSVAVVLARVETVRLGAQPLGLHAAILRDHLEAAAAEAAPPMDSSDEENPLP